MLMMGNDSWANAHSGLEQVGTCWNCVVRMFRLCFDLYIYSPLIRLLYLASIRLCGSYVKAMWGMCSRFVGDVGEKAFVQLKPYIAKAILGFSLIWDLLK